jgi:hypothetical protein
MYIKFQRLKHHSFLASLLDVQLIHWVYVFLSYYDITDLIRCFGLGTR